MQLLTLGHHKKFMEPGPQSMCGNHPFKRQMNSACLRFGFSQAHLMDQISIALKLVGRYLFKILMPTLTHTHKGLTLVVVNINCHNS